MTDRNRRKPRLDATLAAAVTPVFALDRQRRVVFFNHGCEVLTGWKAEEVAGQVCEYLSEPEADSLKALVGAFCPPPIVFEGKAVAVPACIIRRDGDAVSRTIQFVPLHDDQARVECVVGFIQCLDEAPANVAITPAQELHAELAAMKQRLKQRYGFASLVCRSPAMVRVAEQIKLASTSSVGVLLRGELGAGREHVARVIHHADETTLGAFVPIDCKTAVPVDLKQSLKRMFEMSREAAADATFRLMGVHPQTLYLQNVEALTLDVQELLVETFRQPASAPPALRLIAATSVDLEPVLQQGALAGDFYYLVSTLQIEVPPLRRRREDLPLLCQAAVEACNRDAEKQVGGVDPEVAEKFREYNWPGNLDELVAVVSEAWTACDSDLIRAANLPFRFRTGLDAQAVGPSIDQSTRKLEAVLEQVEREEIERALERSRHNKSKAAKLLGLTRARLYRRMQALQIADLEEPTA